VPAPTSSRIPAAAQRLDVPVVLAPAQCRSLLDDLATITDPRQRRGRRHALGAVLAVAVAAVLAGARSLVAIGEWAADAPGPVLVALGVRRDPLRRVWRPPGEATVRRVLACVDPDALDLVIGRWLADQQPPPARAWRQAVAVDGKTLRGSGHHGRSQVHLLAAMDHTTRAVLSQTDVDHTTNEIARFRPLLEGLDLAGRVVTADALHTQREHGDWLVTVKQAAYLLIVKANQPSLHHQLARLPWRDIPAQDHTRDRGHARVEIRRLQVTTVAGLDFPHATQAIRITRRVRPLAGRRWRTVTVYAVTSLTAAQASPAPGRLDPGAVGHRGAAPPSRYHLRRGRLPGPYRRRAPGHGQPAQPGHRHPARPRRPQPRRRAAPQRPRRHPGPAAAGHPRPMNQKLRHNAEALGPRP
jgi:predicted transposase YbfD/YdcC